jgi:hypothetical protein
LASLRLSYTGVTAPGLRHLADLPALRELHVHGTDLSPADVNFLDTLPLSPASGMVSLEHQPLLIRVIDVRLEGRPAGSPPEVVGDLSIRGTFRSEYPFRLGPEDQVNVRFTHKGARLAPVVLDTGRGLEEFNYPRPSITAAVVSKGDGVYEFRTHAFAWWDPADTTPESLGLQFRLGSTKGWAYHFTVDKAATLLTKQSAK